MYWILINSVLRWLRPGGEDMGTGHGVSDQLSMSSNQKNAESPRSATSRGRLKTPEYPKSGGQSRAQKADNEKITKQQNPAAGPGDSKQSSGHLTHDHNHHLVLSGPAEATPPGPAANEPAVGTAGIQGAEPEHDAAW